MSNFTIRTATNQDDVQISTLLRASYPELMRTHYESEILELALPIMTRANPALLASGSYNLAETEDRTIVGCGGWTMERPGIGEIVERLAHLRHFATHPEFTGNGVGRAVYETCEKDAKRAGVDRLECYASLNAQSFYKALGFEPIELIEVRLRCDFMFESMLMTREI
jgi:N-acetylglutamate synthase-like GNAT family acetyltransferase